MNKRRKKLEHANPVKVIVFIIFLIEGLTMAYAIFWAIASSLNTHTDLILNGLALPKKLHFKNYLDAFTVLQTSDASFLEMMWNTVWLTVGKSFVSLACMVMAAYAFARFEFVGKKTIMAIMMIALLIPVYGNGSATLKMYMRLGMYDSPLFLAASASALGMMTLIIKTFFQNIPMAYEESAKLDGASTLRIFLQIHIPMVRTSLFSIFILQFIDGWNDYATSIYYLPSYPTIASGLFVYESLSKFAMNKPVYFAGVMLCAIPPMIVFTLFNDKLMTNISVGGLKG